MTPHLPYLQNNIIFRIASANAISKFKAAQSHSLIQISRREFEFDHRAREVLLLSYDRLSTWILRIERAFLAYPHAELNSDFNARIFNDLNELFDSIEDELINHSKIFNADLTEYVKLIHGYSLSILRAELGRALVGDICSAFNKMTEVLTRYLQHLLLALHEYNNNCILNRPAFICISKFSASLKDKEYWCAPIAARAAFFKTTHHINTFTVKNYTETVTEDDVIAKLNGFGIAATKEVR